MTRDGPTASHGQEMGAEKRGDSNDEIRSEGIDHTGAYAQSPVPSLDEKIKSSGILVVLLPLTSRGQSVSELENSLRPLSACLPSSSECSIFVGIDSDDSLLSKDGRISETCRSLFSTCMSTYSVTYPVFAPSSPPRICTIANELAMQAYASLSPRFDWFLLLGDDITIIHQQDSSRSTSWFGDVIAAFGDIERQVHNTLHIRVPSGFGVVAIPDETFPGFPTFPVVGRLHIDIFGHLYPDAFVNQDADPYVWELYRPFGARMFARGVTLKNDIEGDEDRPARYRRLHINWKTTLLQDGTNQIADYLKRIHSGPVDRIVTIDVIVPTFRCMEEKLRSIVCLSSPACYSVRFIIIIDDPAHASLRERLERDFRDRVLVRVNETNMGASYSRNRGLNEATADWILFLDDDVEPNCWILHAYVRAIKEDGDGACGFAMNFFCRQPPIG